MTTVPDEYLGDDQPEVPGVYLRVAVDLFEDPALACAVADVGPMAYTWWMAVLCAAKDARDFGRVTTSGPQLAKLVGDIRLAGEAEAAVAAFRAAGLIDLDSVDRSQVHVRVLNWRAWQTMTSTERSKLHRAKAADDATRERPMQRESVPGDASASAATPQRGERGEGIQETDDVVVPIARAREAREAAPAEDLPPGAHGMTTKWQPVLDHLTFLHDGDVGKMNWLVNDLSMNARRTGLPVDAYERAGADMDRRLKAGWKPERPSALLGYLMKSATGHRYAVTLPDVESTDQTTDQNDQNDHRPGSQYAFLD